MDSELHQIEAEVHHKRADLELERKKWEFNVKDVTQEYEHMEDQITHMRKQVVITKQINEEEVVHLNRQLENFSLKGGMSEKIAKMKEDDI